MHPLTRSNIHRARRFRRMAKRMLRYEREYEACEAKTIECPKGFKTFFAKKVVKQARILRKAKSLESKMKRLAG